jgi:hypothetical protein
MVNGKNKNDAAVNLKRTIYYSPFTICQRKEERSLTLLTSLKLLGPLEVAISFGRGRGRHVNVDFLCATAAKQPSSKCKEHYQNDDHEDHQYRDNARAAATITIISHEATPPVLGGTN